MEAGVRRARRGARQAAGCRCRAAPVLEIPAAGARAVNGAGARRRRAPSSSRCRPLDVPAFLRRQRKGSQHPAVSPGGEPATRRRACRRGCLRRVDSGSAAVCHALRRALLLRPRARSPRGKLNISTARASVAASAAAARSQGSLAAAIAVIGSSTCRRASEGAALARRTCVGLRARAADLSPRPPLAGVRLVQFMKIWEHRERARATLAREVGYVQKPHGGRLRVALAFPNTYFVGMSSLGFQTVYRLFNDLDDVVCERVFLPGQAGAAGAAGVRPAAADARVADAGARLRRVRVLGLVRMGLHERRVDAAPGRHRAARGRSRTGHDPLIVIGGAVTFVNPEPLALVRGRDLPRAKARC